MAEVVALPPLVARLIAELGYPFLDEATSDLPGRAGGEWLVFMPGHGQVHAETADVAVILPELLSVFRGRLKAAVAGPALEKALRRQLDGIALPALVVVRGHELLGAIPRIRDWSDYIETIGGMIDAGRLSPASSAIQ